MEIDISVLKKYIIDAKRAWFCAKCGLAKDIHDKPKYKLHISNSLYGGAHPWEPKPEYAIADALENAIAEIEQLKINVDLQHGASLAQDSREREAGVKCSVIYEESSCDRPDAVAEEILILREELEKTHKILGWFNA